MSEARDNAIEKLDLILAELYEAGLNAHTLRPPSNVVELCRKEILSLTGIAVVNRNAKPPTLGDESHTDDYVDGHIRARKDMVEQGWLLEVK